MSVGIWKISVLGFFQQTRVFVSLKMNYCHFHYRKENSLGTVATLTMRQHCCAFIAEFQESTWIFLLLLPDLVARLLQAVPSQFTMNVAPSATLAAWSLHQYICSELQLKTNVTYLEYRFPDKNQSDAALPLTLKYFTCICASYFCCLLYNLIMLCQGVKCNRNYFCVLGSSELLWIDAASCNDLIAPGACQ